MALFGRKIEYPTIQDGNYLEPVLARVSKRDEERKILKGFLLARSTTGQRRLEEIVEESYLVAKETLVFPRNLRDSVIDYFLKRLKTLQGEGGLCLYDDLSCELIKVTDRRAAEVARRFKQGKLPTADLPTDLPRKFKEADTLLLGKLRSEIGLREYQSYVQAQELQRRMQAVAQDLFYGVNKGFSIEQTIRLMAVFYELRKLQIRVPTNEGRLRENIFRAIVGEPLDIIHIKCVRFTYPYGERMEIIDHLGPFSTIGKDGNNIDFESQEPLLDELALFREVFVKHGIRAKLLVLVNDLDLYDHFPEGDVIVAPGDIVAAQRAIDRYTALIDSNLKAGHAMKLSEYFELKGTKSAFEFSKRQSHTDLKREGGIVPKKYVESEVNNRFDFNQKMFAKETCRQYARERIYLEIATMQALGVLDGRAINHQENMFLLQKDMGNDSTFIGGHDKTALPVFFADLSY